MSGFEKEIQYLTVTIGSTTCKEASYQEKPIMKKIKKKTFKKVQAFYKQQNLPQMCFSENLLLLVLQVLLQWFHNVFKPYFIHETFVFIYY